MTTNDPPGPPALAGEIRSPFVQIASDVLYSGIEPDALHLYLILLDKSWKRGCCWPSDRTIGEWLGGKSHDTVNRIFKKLERRGLVVRTEVPITDENRSGRLITVNGRVRPPRKSAGRGRARPADSPHANLRDNSNTGKKKEDRPSPPETGAASGPTGSIEAQLAELRELAATGPHPAMRRFAAARIAELRAQIDAQCVTQERAAV